MSTSDRPMTEEAQKAAASPPAGDATALSERIRRVIDDQINPAVAMHGGVITLVEVKDNKAYVHMGGGCQGCGMAAMTLSSGVQALLLEEVPELDAVVDVTNHGAGDTPYYR